MKQFRGDRVKVAQLTRHGLPEIWGAIGLVLLSFLWVTPGWTASLKVRDQEVVQTVRLKVGQSKVLRTPFAITRISVADPEVADIILTSPQEIYINGLAPGVTNLSLWGKARFSSARVTVEADVTLLKEKLAQVLPGEKIGVQAADESLVLTGEVSGPVAQQTALSLAVPFVGGKKDRVINLLHVGGVQQVLLAVRVAEINRNVAKDLGVNFAIIGPNSLGVSAIGGLTTIQNLILGTGGPAGNLGQAAALVQTLSPSINAAAAFTTGEFMWNLFFRMLKQNNLGRVLAEPNLVTTSGQEASFLAGGEFPVPVPQQFQTITIEYKKFGVGLVFTPTVLDDGKIGMKVAPEVSEPDPTFSVVTVGGITAVGLRVRRLSSHIEVKDGQTFAIAGLISDQVRASVAKFPILGSLPVLGPLFRSTQWQKQETELVVLCTPYLVKPIPAQAVRLPTDKYLDPSDVELYLMGCLEGRGQPEAAPAGPSSLPPEFGRQPVK
jgi:pilus assembly protein CpaC